MLNYFWIGVGSALGGMMRYGMSGWVAVRMGPSFPWGTLVVNMSGSFLIGLIGSLTLPQGRLWITPMARDFLMLGICGGYTTFSSFSLQTLHLMRDGDWLSASLNVLGSVLGCLAAVWLGHVCAMSFNQMKGH